MLFSKAKLFWFFRTCLPGNITASSPSGINFTGNLNASGYLKSGNSIYIDGTQTGANESDKIYSSQNLLSFLRGIPGGAPQEGNIRVGIGKNPTLSDAKFTVKGSPANSGFDPIWHLKIINDFNEDIFSISEILLPAGMNYTQTTINIGKNYINGTSLINLNGAVEINGSLMHVCTVYGCNANLNNVFVNDQNFHIKSNVGEDVNIQLETKKGNSWVIFSKDDVVSIPGFSGSWVNFPPIEYEVNYFGIHNNETGKTPLFIDPVLERVYISRDLIVNNNMHINNDLDVCGIITTSKVKVNPAGWCDYVFDNTYKLNELDHVKAFIAKNHHLPEIPSAKEVEEKGLDLGGMMTLVMKKIEEIFLYLFKHEEKLMAHENELNEIRAENSLLKIRLNSQEKKLDSLIIVLFEKK